MQDPTNRKMTKIAREAQKLVITTMKETGIGSGEFDLIHFVRHHPGTSQKEIAAALNMDKGAASRRVANLEAKGYLYRIKNPSDRRSMRLYATNKAENLKLSKTRMETAFYTFLLEDLPEEEKDAFLKTLDTLYWRSKKESRAGFPHVRCMLDDNADDGKKAEDTPKDSGKEDPNMPAPNHPDISFDDASTDDTST